MLAMAPGAFAQVIPLPNDTMRVVDAAGRPGDTVSVFVYFGNYSIPVSAYSGRIVFNTNVLQPIDYNCIDRGCVLAFNPYQVHQDSAMVFAGYSFDRVYIPVGSGRVGVFRFRVRTTATPGSITIIRFADYGTEFINAWSDTTVPVSDTYVPTLINGNFSVLGGLSNSPPVVGNIGSQQVAEGQLLQFQVSAHDYDADPITLSAQNLPANATFPTVQGDSSVSGLFSFAPSFEQGPDTFYVGFVATDDHNNTNLMNVQIIVLDQPNDRLVVNSGQGGVPGAIGRPVEIDLFNSRDIYGIQLEYYFDDTQIQITDVIPTERCLGLGFWNSMPIHGRIIILIFSGGLDPIEQGSGPIVRMITNVTAAATFGPTSVVLDSAIEVIDSVGTSRRLVTENGVFTVDRFGDANLDLAVNVGDCVTVVAFIIEQIQLNIRQFDAADINRDGRVNVSDLQAVVNVILQSPITSPGPTPPPRPITVELSPEVARVGDLVTIDLLADISVEAAAVQYQLTYNPNHLEPLAVDDGPMVSQMLSEKNIATGKISGVHYDLAGATFGPTTGSLASFTFRLKTGDFNPGDLAITDFAIVDRGAALIPSEVKGQLPTQYILNQNYPNPFNASTTISFDLPSGSDVELTVYDITGRKIATLVTGYLPAGNHSFTWNGRSEFGESMASGMFFYRLRSSSFDETKKMLLVK
jgi:hypothetical protein